MLGRSLDPCLTDRRGVLCFSSGLNSWSRRHLPVQDFVQKDPLVHHSLDMFWHACMILYGNLVLKWHWHVEAQRAPCSLNDLRPAREGPETLFRTVFRAKLAKKVQSFLSLQGKSEERSLRGVISPPPSSHPPETPSPNPPQPWWLSHILTDVQTF